MRHVFSQLTALVLCCSLALPAFGATENEQAAQAAFDEAIRLIKLKKYGEACAHLKRSQDLDPAMGTQFRLAECYEKLGRFASAYDQYISVAEAAKESKQKEKESVARARAAALESKTARLTIDISSSVAELRGVEIRRDGVSVEKASWGQPVTIDLGDHVVTVHAPDKQPFERKFWADASAKLVISVAALDGAKRAAVKPRSKIPVFVMGGVGVVGVGLGITFVALRSTQLTQLKKEGNLITADGGNCRSDGPPEYATKCASLLQIAKRGDSYGTASIIGFSVAGAALLGMGAYLLWPDPKPRDEQAMRWQIVPVIGSTNSGFAVSGVF